eukprot:701436-Rhodomonas_salina.1
MDAVLTYLEDYARPDDPLVLGMTRLLCLWSLEVNSDLYTDRLCAVWPLLAKANLKGGGGRALQWMLPALPVVLQEERVCDAFVRAEGPAALAEMLVEARKAAGRTTAAAAQGTMEDGALGGQEEEAWEALSMALKR